MKVISIFNIKGGVGKTTTAVNLSTCLAKEGKSVLLLDIDAQSNSTKNLDRYNSEKPSTYDLLIDKKLDTVDVIQDTEIDNLDIIPSSINLIMAENQILNDTLRARETRIKNSIKEIEEDYDYCIIDCPPSLSTLVTNSLVASDAVITPIKIDKFALDGFSNLMSTIENVREEFNPNLDFMGVLITMDKTTTVNKEIKNFLKENIGDKLFKTTIRDNVDVIKSTFDNKPVVIFNPKSNASVDYIEFSKEVMNYE